MRALTQGIGQSGVWQLEVKHNQANRRIFLYLAESSPDPLLQSCGLDGMEGLYSADGRPRTANGKSYPTRLVDADFRRIVLKRLAPSSTRRALSNAFKCSEHLYVGVSEDREAMKKIVRVMREVNDADTRRFAMYSLDHHWRSEPEITEAFLIALKDPNLNVHNLAMNLIGRRAEGGVIDAASVPAIKAEVKRLRQSSPEEANACMRKLETYWP